MNQFLWLSWMTASVIWPLYALAAAAVLVSALRRYAQDPAERLPLDLMAVVLGAPFLLPLWAAITYGAEKGSGFGWASGVLCALAVATVAFACRSFWRWRSRWLAAGLCTLASLVATLLNWFVGAMAIVDDWI